MSDPREPIIRFLDRVLGPDDLVAVMTASMAASDITFARKADAIQRGLRERPFWGEKRDDLTKGPTLAQDDRERMYQMCYPFNQELSEAMIARRRERMTFDALRDLGDKVPSAERGAIERHWTGPLAHQYQRPACHRRGHSARAEFGLGKASTGKCCASDSGFIGTRLRRI